MNKPAPRKVSNKKFSDPEWYVSLAADILDLKFATLAKDLGKALNPEVADTAKELVAIYQLAFVNSLQNQQGLPNDIKVTVAPGSEQLFFEHIIDPNFPSYHPLFQQLITPIELAYINQTSDGFSQSWLDFNRSLRQAFGINFSSIIQSGAGEYPQATAYIEQLKSCVEPDESQVIAHMNGLLTDLEHDALAIDPDLTLRKSYVTPTCQMKLAKIQQDPAKAEQEQQQQPNIIQALLQQIEQSHHPIVIHGQPGHGKTSTVKMLVGALAQSYQANNQPLAVLFYEFKNLRALGDPIVKVLNAETAFVADEAFFHGKHSVLIFDGLDERQLADGSDDALKGFVSGLFRLAQRMNQTPNTRLNLILTGRSQYVGQIKQSFNTDHWVIEIEDFAEDKIRLWLERFNAQKNTPVTNTAENITLEQLHGYHLQELLPQPILLAISSIMLADHEGKKLLTELGGRGNKTINRSQIYRIIIQWSYAKKWQKTPTAALNDRLTFDEYFLLLQAIAFEMFKSGQESIKLSVLVPALQSSVFDLDFLDNKSLEYIEQLCSQLRISFFFKGVEDKAFAFLHKSIKDFLIVSGLVEALLALLDDCKIKKLDKEAQDLYQIFGQAWLSSEDHIPMLEEWIGLRADTFRPHHDKLMAIWERLGKHDFEVPFTTPGQAITTQRNMLHNYYQLISRYFPLLSNAEDQLLFDNEKVVLFGSREACRWQLMGRGEFCEIVLAKRAVKLSFKNQYLKGDLGAKSFANEMVGQDFTLCTIQWGYFISSRFDRCNFESAQLLNCCIGDFTFDHCNFTDSIIDCISGNATQDNFPIRFNFFNHFINCNFLNAKLSGAIQGSGFGKKQFLFWDCDFAATEFDCEANSTVEYSDNFTGVKLPLIV